MKLVDENLPTSTLLEIKLNDTIYNLEGKSGLVCSIDIQETEQLLLFLFTLTNGSVLEIKKIKNIC